MLRTPVSRATKWGYRLRSGANRSRIESKPKPKPSFVKPRDVHTERSQAETEIYHQHFGLKWRIRPCFVVLMDALKLATLVAHAKLRAITISPPARGAGRGKKHASTPSPSQGQRRGSASDLARVPLQHRRRLRLGISASPVTMPCLRRRVIA